MAKERCQIITYNKYIYGFSGAGKVYINTSPGSYKHFSGSGEELIYTSPAPEKYLCIHLSDIFPSPNDALILFTNTSPAPKSLYYMHLSDTSMLVADCRLSHFDE